MRPPPSVTTRPLPIPDHRTSWGKPVAQHAASRWPPRLPHTVETVTRGVPGGGGGRRRRDGDRVGQASRVGGRLSTIRWTSRRAGAPAGGQASRLAGSTAPPGKLSGSACGAAACATRRRHRSVAGGSPPGVGTVTEGGRQCARRHRLSSATLRRGPAPPRTQIPRAQPARSPAADATADATTGKA